MPGMNKFISWIMRIAIPLLGILLTAWGIFFVGSDKELSYEVISSTQFNSGTSGKWAGFSIFYQGLEIENGGVVTVRIANSGSVPINATDFNGPIILLSGDNTNFIDARLISSKPTNINPKILAVDGVINIEPILLNPSDEIQIQAIGVGTTSHVLVKARIAGVAEVDDLTKTRQDNLYLFSWLLVLYGLLGVAIYSTIGDVVVFKLLFKTEKEIPVHSLFLTIIVVFISAFISFMKFVEIHNMDIGWNTIWYILGLLILSQILGIPFRGRVRHRNDEAN